MLQANLYHPFPFTFIGVLVFLAGISLAFYADWKGHKKKMERLEKNRYPKATKQQRINKVEIDRLLGLDEHERMIS